VVVSCGGAASTVTTGWRPRDGRSPRKAAPTAPGSDRPRTGTWLYPALAAQWHPSRNGDLSPAHLLPRSGQPVWWRCGQGHEWAAPPDRRVGGVGCPYCAGKRPTPDRNLAAQWHPTRNGTLRPDDVTPRAGTRVWWHCEHGHEWQARLSSRTRGATGCPQCARLRRRQACA